MQGLYLPGDFRAELRPLPVPQPGHGQVLVKMRASGICGSDLRVIYGKRDPAQCEQPSEVVCGHEPCGEIAQAGPGCRRFKAGDRVMLYHIAGCGRCAECHRGYMLMCEEAPMPSDSTVFYKAYGWQRDGGHADFLLAEESTCVLLPPNLSFVDGALIACGVGTVFEALRRMECSGRHALLVTGLGPVGLAAALVARAMGVKRIYGIDSNTYRINFAKEKGLVDVAVDVRTTSEKQLREMIAGRENQLSLVPDLQGVDRAIDCSGVAAARHAALYCTKRWGEVAFVGEGGLVQFEVSPVLIHKQLKLHGSWVTSVPHMAEVAELLSKQDLHAEVIVSHRFSLQQGAEAYATASRGECAKVVIVMD